MAVVADGSCPGYSYSVAIVLGGSCPKWQLSWVAVVAGGSCPGGCCPDTMCIRTTKILLRFYLNRGWGYFPESKLYTL